MTDPTNTFATPRVAAGVLFTDAQGRILMLRPTYKNFWDIPGGYVEAGETPLAASAREVREEIGLQVQVGALLVVDWAPHPDEGDKLLFVFDGGELTGDQLAGIRFADGEIAEWAFVESGQLGEATVQRLRRRLEQALAARRKGRTLYLQHGAVAGEQPLRQ